MDFCVFSTVSLFIFTVKAEDDLDNTLKRFAVDANLTFENPLPGKQIYKVISVVINY